MTRSSSQTNPAKNVQKLWNNNRPELNRAGSKDNVRKIVEKEGKIARNLVAWNVPSEKERAKSADKTTVGKTTKVFKSTTPSSKQQRRGRPKSRKQTGNSSASQTSESKEAKHGETKDPTSEKLTLEKKDSRVTKSEEYQARILKAIETSSENLNPQQRPSSAASILSQKNLRARYWSYLFDNFHRAVDEIYLTCENDESIIECKEVIMMLDSCKRDFQGLINRLELFSKIEQSDVKPQALAWEIRKQMSPGKCPSPNLRRSPSPAAVRFLNFTSPSKSNFSWADRVRGITSANNGGNDNPKNLSILTDLKECQNKHCFPSPVLENSIEEVPFGGKVANHSYNEQQQIHQKTLTENIDQNDDNEGWEIVTKGRSRSKTSSVSVSSSSSNLSSKKTTSSHLLQKQTTNQSNTNIVASDHVLTHNTGITKVSLPDDTPPLSVTSTIQEFHECEFEEVNVDSKLDLDSFADATLDFSYDFTDDEIQLQIKEEQEKALASAIAEEETLTKELEEEALKDDDQDDDLSSDRDFNNTDDGRDTPKDLSEELPLDSSMDEPDKVLTWEEMCQQYDEKYDSTSTANWGDLMDLSESMRMPGRALEMHQKLSSPSRKKSRSESVKRSEEKMARVERKRLRLLVDKCQRLKDLSERVQKVRELKNKLIQDKERTMLDHMKRAELNRKIVIQEKIKKAQEEELKVNEIAFINTLEAQNKKIEVQEKHQISEARLQDLLEERQRRREDKQAKEEAAQEKSTSQNIHAKNQERRKALERERIARLQEIKQKRGSQAAKWAKERDERERKREEQAKERQHDREQKVAARNEALQHAAEELQRRIEQKHIESTRRHVQRMEEVKEKSRAASSSRHSTIEETPSAVPYEKPKRCTLCDVEILSDVYMVSHLKGNKHKVSIKEINKKITDAEMEAFSSKYIKESEENNSKKQKEIDDRRKVLKKRLKKIRARMAAKAKEYETNLQGNSKATDSTKQGKFQKSIKDINKILQAHCNGSWPANKVASLDKALCEIIRTLDGKNVVDQKAFSQLGGLTVLARVLLLWDMSLIEKSPKHLLVPPKIIKHACEAIQAACSRCVENCQYFLLSNKLGIVVDLLTYRLKFLDQSSNDEQAANSESHVQKPRSSSFDQNLPLPTPNFKDNLVESSLTTLQQDERLTLILMATIHLVLQVLYPRWPVPKEKNGLPQDMEQRLSDVVSYIVCCGIPSKFLNVYKNIQGPMEDLALSNVLTCLIHFYQPLAFSVSRPESLFVAKKDELSLLAQLMQQTEAFGLVSLMYSLLHQGSTTRISPSPLPLADSTVLALITALKTLNTLALVDIAAFQNTLSCEGISLQYRSVISYLLRYTSSNEKTDDLLHEVILSIGFFAALNQENQLIIQSGRAPSLLQQLCTLPFGYFSNPRLKNFLFPTLIAACYINHENKRIISQDVNPTLLAIFLEEKLKEKTDATFSVDNIEDRSLLQLRLPYKHWEEARQYFNEPDT